jgi:NAD(P)H-nitrite reductase large subunit
VYHGKTVSQDTRDPPDIDATQDEIDPERTVCFCHNRLAGEILEAIRAGAVTISQIQERTRASTGCGGCEAEIQEILDAELKRQAKLEAAATRAAADRSKASGE